MVGSARPSEVPSALEPESLLSPRLSSCASAFLSTHAAGPVSTQASLTPSLHLFPRTPRVRSAPGRWRGPASVSGTSAEVAGARESPGLWQKQRGTRSTGTRNARGGSALTGGAGPGQAGLGVVGRGARRPPHPAAAPHVGQRAAGRTAGGGLGQGSWGRGRKLRGTPRRGLGRAAFLEGAAPRRGHVLPGERNRPGDPLG